MSKLIGPFRIGPLIGSGATGKVKLGIHKNTGEQVAIKIVLKRVLRSTDPRESIGRAKIEKEMSILEIMDHPNVLRLIRSFEGPKHLFLVMEYVKGGDLFKWIKNCPVVDHKQALVFFQQLIFGLDYMHKMMVCHRDLKPENLLLDDHLNLKIADFGFCHLMKKGQLINSFCGSPHYASPEVLNRKKFDGRKADVWSCGVILFLLLCGRLPFEAQKTKALFEKVRQGNITFPKNLTILQKDLLKKMLTLDPKRRINLKEIKKHEWFTSNFPEKFIIPSVKPVYKLRVKAQFKEVDTDILKKMYFLGCPFSREELKQLVLHQNQSLEKAFYYLYLKRKKKRKRFWNKITKEKNQKNSKSSKKKHQKRNKKKQSLKKQKNQSLNKTNEKDSMSNNIQIQEVKKKLKSENKKSTLTKELQINLDSPKKNKNNNITINYNKNNKNEKHQQKNHENQKKHDNQSPEKNNLSMKKRKIHNSKSDPFITKSNQIEISNQKKQLKKNIDSKGSNQQIKKNPLSKKHSLPDLKKIKHKNKLIKQKSLKNSFKFKTHNQKSNSNSPNNHQNKTKHNQNHNHNQNQNHNHIHNQNHNGEELENSFNKFNIETSDFFKTNKKIYVRINPTEISFKFRKPHIKLLKKLQNAFNTLGFKWKFPHMFLVYASLGNIQIKVKIVQISHSKKWVKFRKKHGSNEEFEKIMEKIIKLMKLF
ncbi:protein kinase [Anaeramoeba flamelloides]|uniref:non-specific serine/threonine protein kinase n=1 Tax=Anaeramoeba flamelloides TaxID=1746091 RepID=A0AAV7YXW3_9EUKA|nr:protein kinase [Anaeramoeba flamelloides]